MTSRISRQSHANLAIDLATARPGLTSSRPNLTGRDLASEDKLRARNLAGGRSILVTQHRAPRSSLRNLSHSRSTSLDLAESRWISHGSRRYLAQISHKSHRHVADISPRSRRISRRPHRSHRASTQAQLVSTSTRCCGCYASLVLSLARPLAQRAGTLAATSVRVKAGVRRIVCSGAYDDDGPPAGNE